MRIVLGQLQLGGKVVFHIAALAVDLYIAIGIAVFQHGKLLARFQGGEYIAHRAPAFVFIWGDDQLRTRLHASLHRGQGGSDVAHLNLRDRVIDNQVGWVLPRQSRLDKGEQQHRNHDEKEKNRDLILEKRPEGGFPVGIIRIAAPLRILGVEFGEGEGFLVAHFRCDILLKLPGELVAQRIGGLVAQGVKS